jgi:YHS domain-containing protein
MKFRAGNLLVIMPILAAILIGAPTVVPAKDPVNTNLNGLAVKGYDAVAYFIEGEPIKGTEDFEYQWQGVKWRFSSAENLERFQANPEKYAPQYGGY